MVNVFTKISHSNPPASPNGFIKNPSIFLLFYLTEIYCPAPSYFLSLYFSSVICPCFLAEELRYRLVKA